jgi:PleD family two-component response regulator
MRRGSIVLALAVVSLFVGSPSLDACGDKLLVLGNGAQFNFTRAEYPARILHYMDPVKGAAVSDSQLRSSLERAGHRFRSARSAKDFKDALGAGQYDIILIDVADARAFEAMIAEVPSDSRPLVLPTVDKDKKTDADAAKRRYQIVLQAPARPVHMLDTIDDAMKLRRQRKAL